jgi:hypothetical protein
MMARHAIQSATTLNWLGMDAPILVALELCGSLIVGPKRHG